MFCRNVAGILPTCLVCEKSVMNQEHVRRRREGRPTAALPR